MKIERIRRGGMVAVALTAALTTGCLMEGELPSDPGAKPAEPDIASVTSALSDPFSTPANSDVAIAYAGDRVMVAWIGNTAAGRNIVGQVFSLVTGVTIPAGSHVYTNDAHAKSSLSAAWDGTRFLITYEDEFSPTDHDILGVFTDAQGLSPSPIVINFSGLNDVTPSVIMVPGPPNNSGGLSLPNPPRFLVSYARTNTSPGNTYIGTYIDQFNNKSADIIFVAPAENQVVRSPRAVFGKVPLGVRFGDVRRLFLTWSNMSVQGGIKFKFADPDTLALFAQVGVGDSLDVMELGVPAYNANTRSFAVAWREQHQNAIFNQIKILVFPSGCTSIDCAIFPQLAPTDFTGATSESKRFRLAPFNSGFQLLYGCSTTNSLNTKAVCSLVMDGNGTPNSSVGRFDMASAPCVASDVATLPNMIDLVPSTSANETYGAWVSTCKTDRTITAARLQLQPNGTFSRRWGVNDTCVSTSFCQP